MSVPEASPIGLSFRALAMLRAVAAGRAQLRCSCEPDLYVDGLACCDQAAAHDLSHAGLIRPLHTGHYGELVPVELTENGRTALTAVPTAA